MILVGKKRVDFMRIDAEFGVKRRDLLSFCNSGLGLKTSDGPNIGKIEQSRVTGELTKG